MNRSTRLVSIQNTPMTIFDPPECISDDIVKYNNFWEYKLFNKWYHHFPKNGLMLDLGANIGSHCLQFITNFPNLNIWAFEPFLENFNLLQTNTKNFKNISCFNVGVGSTTSVVHFSEGHIGNSGVVKVVPTSNLTNLVISLDIIQIPQPVSFVKLDVEGFELSALQGMEEMLVKDRPLVWVEDFSGKAREYLHNLGYKIIEEEEKTNDYLML